jgi:hypothetical protein
MRTHLKAQDGESFAIPPYALLDELCDRFAPLAEVISAAANRAGDDRLTQRTAAAIEHFAKDLEAVASACREHQAEAAGNLADLSTELEEGASAEATARGIMRWAYDLNPENAFEIRDGGKRLVGSTGPG